MMTELSFWEKYPFKSFMFLHYKGLELNSSFIPSSPDCWCRWRNVVSGSRRLWTSAWDFFWKVLRVANQAQRMTLLSGSTMPDRYCDEHAKACLWEIERPMSDTEAQSFHRPKTFKDLDYIMRVSSSVSYWFEAWMWWPLSHCGAGTVGSRQWGGGGRLSREELRRLGACWTRTGAVTSNMRLLFVKHCHQLQRETQRQKEWERGVYI